MKAPDALGELYADLRSRRLLPVIAVLIAALIAVPLLLREDDPQPPSSGVSGTTAPDEFGGAEELQSVVLADVPGVREYEKRLQEFQGRNPFRQQYQSPSAADSESGGSGSGSGSGDGSASASGSGTGGSATAADADRGSSSGGDSEDSGSKQPEVEEYLITFEIDVKVGVVGEAKKKKGVEEFSFLPGVKRPVVQYLTAEGGEAFFVVSRDVESTSGEGACAPTEEACSFLLLKEGEEHRFVYEPDGRTYRLKLTEVTRIKKKIDGASSDAKEAFEGLQGG